MSGKEKTAQLAPAQKGKTGLSNQGTEPFAVVVLLSNELTLPFSFSALSTRDPGIPPISIYGRNCLAPCHFCSGLALFTFQLGTFKEVAYTKVYKVAKSSSFRGFNKGGPGALSLNSLLSPLGEVVHDKEDKKERLVLEAEG
ncbi:UNVERIFIED_CONTAM: hypothetical protein Sradi_7312300 [Sesamum radiatum]|uniref:Uncharacterized protein n=1 Tax=Sesamum radiatum TaxID=300843 RepID=A0AAW2I923_SESRA